MTWFPVEDVLTETEVGQPIRTSTLRKIAANVAAAFAGDSGSPALNKAVSQASLATHGFNEIGTYSAVLKQTADGDPPYTLGATVAGSEWSLTGTWRVMGQVEVLPYDAGGPTNSRWSILLLRVA